MASSLSVIPLVGGGVVVAAGLLALLFEWPFKGRQAVLTWFGRRPIAIGHEWLGASLSFEPGPINAIPGVDALEARILIVHLYNHADHPREVWILGSSRIRGLGEHMVWPRHVRLDAHSGVNVVITVTAAPETFLRPRWAEFPTARLWLRAKTNAGEHVRWRGSVLLYPYRWEEPPGIL